jgi:hypothetical protein
MRAVGAVLIVVAAGGADPRESLSKPRAVVATRGEVQEGVFSADGKAFLGWVTPLGKDPAAERLKPRPWVLWAAADGAEVARWTGDPTPGFLVPGSSDGTAWPIYLSEPPAFVTRCRLLDLTAGALRDVPGVAGPTESCTRPSYSADRSRMAYSDYAANAGRRTGRVYERTAAGWARVAAVAGENAALSPDGTLVATVGYKPGDRSSLVARLFAVADGRERWAAGVDSYGLHGFTPDGRYVVQADNAGHRFLDVATGRQAVLVANGPRGDARGPGEVAYRAGRVAAVVRPGPSAELVRWDVAAGKEVGRTPVTSVPGRNRTPPFGSPRLAVVRSIRNHPVPGRPGASWSGTGVDVYDPAAADPVARLTLGSPGTVVASPDGGTLAAVGYSSLAFHPLPAAR